MRTCLSREFTFLRREAAVSRGCAGWGERRGRVFGDEEIAATEADYLALGHWDRPMRVGNGAVPAYYSGSPELAQTINLVRLTPAGKVIVTREALHR